MRYDRGVTVRTILAATAAVLLGCALAPGPGSAQAASPQPTAVPSPAPASTAPASAVPASPAPLPTRHAAKPEEGPDVTVMCPKATLYNWPHEEGAPYWGGYPAATLGQRIGTIGGVKMSLDGLALRETTIDVLEPYGGGKHYWIADTCVNTNGANYKSH